VSVDLDPVECYYRIHALDGAPMLDSETRYAVLRRCLPRFRDLFARHGVRATFFVVGLSGELHPDLLKREIAEGHEIGNHTYTHSMPLGLQRDAVAIAPGDLHDIAVHVAIIGGLEVARVPVPVARVTRGANCNYAGKDLEVAAPRARGWWGSWRGGGGCR